MSFFITDSDTGIAFDYAISSDMRLVLALFLLSMLSNAQTVDREKEAIIRQIVQASSPATLKKQILNMTALFRNTVLRQNPTYPAGYGDEFQQRFAEHIKEADLVELSVPIYAKTFTLEELKQILDFHQSPVGRKLAASQPEILSETVQASMLYARQLVPSIEREIIAAHPEWKEQLQERSGGNGDSRPVLISKVEPQAPQVAQGESPKGGTVLLSIMIDENGVPQDVRIFRSLDSGFDEKAIEAVQKWRFKPATQGGLPVKTEAKVEVNFRAIQK